MLLAMTSPHQAFAPSPFFGAHLARAQSASGATTFASAVSPRPKPRKRAAISFRRKLATAAAIAAASVLPGAARFARAVPAQVDAMPLTVAVKTSAMTGGSRSLRRAVRVMPNSVAMASPTSHAATLPAFTLRERFSFALNEVWMWNPAVRIVGLFALTTALILVGAVLFHVLDPNREETPAPLWSSIRAFVRHSAPIAESTRIRVKCNRRVCV
jgi:hypothetical protein